MGLVLETRPPNNAFNTRKYAAIPATMIGIIRSKRTMSDMKILLIIALSGTRVASADEALITKFYFI
jgi:hypothetical protein